MNRFQEKEQNLDLDEEAISFMYKKLQQYCQFITRNEWDGNDLAQETITKALCHYEAKSAITFPLLKKVAYNQWIDTIRKREKETIEEEVQMPEVVDSHMEKTLFVTDFLLNNLTPKQAIIFLLKEGFDYQAQEIAQILTMTEGSVKSSIHRIKARLKKEQDGWCSPIIDSFWVDEERSKMAGLLHAAIQDQDPTILLKAIPLFDCLKPEFSALTKVQRSLPSHTPYCTLRNAA